MPSSRMVEFRIGIRKSSQSLQSMSEFDSTAFRARGGTKDSDEPNPIFYENRRALAYGTLNWVALF